MLVLQYGGNDRGWQGGLATTANATYITSIIIDHNPKVVWQHSLLGIDNMLREFLAHGLAMLVECPWFELGGWMVGQLGRHNLV